MSRLYRADPVLYRLYAGLWHGSRTMSKTKTFPTPFITRDSGERRAFPTGSVRDRGAGKPRYDLISPWALQRLAELYQRGAEKYGDRNWEKGQPVSDITASLFRHLVAYMQGELTEDHLAAVAWNAFAIMHFEELAKRGDAAAKAMLDAYASQELDL